MASPKDNDDTAIKNRIITHMNTSHQDSLTRYLRQTHHLPLSTARHATLHSLTLSTLTLTLSPSSPSPTAPKYQIPITPPLKTYAEARARLAAMDAAACTALDLAPYTLTHYDPPRGIRLFIFILIFLETLLLSRRAHFLPPSVIHHVLTQFIPYYGAQIASFCARTHFAILAVIYAIHGVQAWRMDRTRLRRYNVVRLGRVWWLWMGDAMVEGLYAFPPVDEWARGEEERRRREKERH
ncbi:MAG: hypothetical protein LQ339_003889 [Xanthoria mediterranea]|nr:MAG: hypothetical protein LQ339_003889 [Xanthoria mediterranea]